MLIRECHIMTRIVFLCVSTCACRLVMRIVQQADSRSHAQITETSTSSLIRNRTS
jgi:hypothetical protein